ncbi:DNA-3-methyladenine glycosylase I [bacterium]|nr:DNA-3-methyladenine glycosylase I [bacterium]
MTIDGSRNEERNLLLKEKIRCPWPVNDPLYIDYHDREWGTPVHDERKHFEFLVLETMQAGLSWHIILKKRENFRKAFDGFDPVRVAKYDERKIRALLNDAGIVRNRLKIRAAVNNAQRFLEVQKEFGTFNAYLWGFVNGKTVQNRRRRLRDLPARTPLSDRVSLDLKKRGFRFTGTTVIYAHLQAVGVVNDHLVSCFRHHELFKSSGRRKT